LAATFKIVDKENWKNPLESPFGERGKDNLPAILLPG
jgi:hypothetical protein